MFQHLRRLFGDLTGLKDAVRTNVELFGGYEVDFIVTDCGGCGAELKRYGHHLDEDGAAEACCGSAGTYNIERPEMSDRILKRKLDTIRATGAEVLVTSNPGCLLQLKKGCRINNPQSGSCT